MTYQSPYRKKVLFASQIPQWPVSAMLKADAFADYLDSELFVLQVSKPARSWRGLFRHEPARAAIRALERWTQDRDQTFARCNYVLPDSISADHVLVRQGDFVREVAQAVADTAAQLVVLPPNKRGNGLLAMDIALAVQVPVLIARPPRSHNIVVAATNLADSRYPVIREAGFIGGCSGAELVLMHNVVPRLLLPGWESSNSLLPHSEARVEPSPASHLHEVARHVPRCSAAVVKGELNTAQAILETGRECDADLIVVGVLHESSRIERWLGGNIAAQVAEQARRSVLVTPIAARAAVEFARTGAA